MAQWQAPTVHNERTPADVGVSAYGTARPYLDVDGIIRWWSGTANDLPVGTTPLYVTIRTADSRRVFSTDAVNERRPVLFGSHILLR